MNTTSTIIISVLVVIGIGYIVLTNSAVTDPVGSETSVPIQNEYETKIVYTTELDSEKKDVLIEDCDARGGVFNECGSACAPDAEICTSVCAYTCEFE